MISFELLCVDCSMVLMINDDLTLQSQKYSSSLVEVYDAIEVMWKHVYTYYGQVRVVLEVWWHESFASFVFLSLSTITFASSRL